MSTHFFQWRRSPSKESSPSDETVSTDVPFEFEWVDDEKHEVSEKTQDTQAPPSPAVEPPESNGGAEPHCKTVVDGIATDHSAQDLAQTDLELKSAVDDILANALIGADEEPTETEPKDVSPENFVGLDTLRLRSAKKSPPSTPKLRRSFFCGCF